MTKALVGVEMLSPEPHALAEHWGHILELPVGASHTGEPQLLLPNCSFRFVRGESEIMSGLTFQVGDVAAVSEAARERGHSVSGNTFQLGGITYHLVA